MSEVFVVRNQLGHYWGKSKKWVDGRVPKAVLRAKHEDEAINTLFELGSKDFELRGEVIAVGLSDRNEPVIEASEHLIEEEPESTELEHAESETGAPETIVEEATDTAQENASEEDKAAAT
ncbi:MAG: hypothetical protein AB8C02_10480 [Halioglobus sp.]